MRLALEFLASGYAYDVFGSTAENNQAMLYELMLVLSKPGDRVFAFHEIQKPHGSYAEYALAWAYTTCGLATDITYEG
jgi:NADPH:quinone reductase-like Zn-dependent oxidoreductase